jgi:hypothetical protein
MSGRSKNGFRVKWKNESDLKWLDYKEDKDAVFCKVCIAAKGHTLGSNFNGNGFTGGRNGMQLSDLRTHTISAGHMKSLQYLDSTRDIQVAINNSKRKQAEKLEKQQESIDLSEWYPHSIRAAYFLAKNNLPFKLMDQLCFLIQDVVKTSTGTEFNLGYGSYSNQMSAKEIVSSISQDISKTTIDILKNAEHFSIMIDESTDVSTSKNLVMNARFVEKGVVKTRFLELIPIDSGDADTITNCVKTFLEKNELPLTNLVGFASDGASVMTGSSNGVAVQLKRINPLLLDIHCAAHRLQLAIQDATTDFDDFFIGIVKKTSNYFSKSSGRLQRLKSICQDLDHTFYTTLKTIDTRWLSLGNSLKNLMKIYQPIHELLIQDQQSSAIAHELHGMYTTNTFKYWLAFMDDICDQLNKLSRSIKSNAMLKGWRRGYGFQLERTC